MMYYEYCSFDSVSLSTHFYSLRAISSVSDGLQKTVFINICIFLNNYLLFFFNLAAPNLSCGTQDLHSSLWHLGSLVVA